MGKKWSLMTEEEKAHHRQMRRENYKRKHLLMSDEEKAEEAKRRSEYYYANRDDRVAKRKIYEKKNRDRIYEYKRKLIKQLIERDGDKYREKKRKLSQGHRDRAKDFLYNILGRKCVNCGKTEEYLLTIDHIHDDGKEDHDRYRNLWLGIYSKYINGMTEEQIKEKYQILCWNCNLGKNNRDYLDLPTEGLDRKRRRRIKLWREAFEFFGPKCKMCGETNIKFLTIDHINNDGAERRRNGEKGATDLIQTFKNRDWEESIKKDYQLLCFNCNNGRKVRGVDKS